MFRARRTYPAPLPSRIESEEVVQVQNLEQHFQQFRNGIIGDDQDFQSPYGLHKILYADWTASGRLYAPIEATIATKFGPYVANTHTETSVTGMAMTEAYHHAQSLIKQHVNAGPADVILTAGAGMTRLVTKFQRILGLRVSEQACKNKFVDMRALAEEDRPVVFVTHMEHHSNQTTWLETVAEVVVLQHKNGLVDPAALALELAKYKGRKLKIGAFTAGSNVTGVVPPYHALAKLMHAAGGLCFVDFAASAPYIKIDMHPADPEERLDAIYFSPHKFLGGPGSAAVLVFDSALYDGACPPDMPGGGTVKWTNPWGGRSYVEDIEAREDGGTPAFLQTIKTALCIKLKEQMGVDNILRREHQLVQQAFAGLRKVPGIVVCEGHLEDRLGIMSFRVPPIHHNLLTQLLNDRFGIQVRGGCSCAGTYGHHLLGVGPEGSRRMAEAVEAGDWSVKPGWVRLSLHPTMTDAELAFILDAIRQVVVNIDAWGAAYTHTPNTEAWVYTGAGRGAAAASGTKAMVHAWFDLDDPPAPQSPKKAVRPAQRSKAHRLLGFLHLG